MARACVIVLDAVGAGELPDASEFGDAGSNTLANVARAVGGLDLPTLEALGFGNIEPLEGLRAAAGGARGRRTAPRAFEGQGHDDGPLGADGGRHAPGDAHLPVRLPGRGDRSVHESHRPRRAGKQARERNGDHPGARRGASAHREVDRLHERRLGLPDRRARGDRAARGALRRLPHRTRAPDRQARGRARDRASVHGVPGSYERTPNRHDFSLEPRRPNYLSLVRDAGHKVHGVGKIGDIFAHQDIDEEFTSRSPTSRGFRRPKSCCGRSTTV